VKRAPWGLAAHSQSLATSPTHHGQTNSRLSRLTAWKYWPIGKGGKEMEKRGGTGPPRGLDWYLCLGCALAAVHRSEPPSLQRCPHAEQA
jgi:hypothetical protein